MYTNVFHTLARSFLTTINIVSGSVTAVVVAAAAAAAIQEIYREKKKERRSSHSHNLFIDFCIAFVFLLSF